MKIILIGGPPKCGKTTLAKTMSEKFSIPYVSVDALEDIVMSTTPMEDFADLFPHACTKGESNDTFYTNYSTERIVQDYIQQGRATRESVCKIIDHAVHNNESVIIEGHQLSPEFVASLAVTHEIRPLFLLKMDAENMATDFLKSSTPNDWIIRKTKNAETFSKIAEMIALYSDYFEKEALTFGFDTMRMDDRFEQRIAEATDLLMK